MQISNLFAKPARPWKKFVLPVNWFWAFGVYESGETKQENSELSDKEYKILGHDRSTW